MQSPKSPIRALPNNSSRLGTGRCPLSWKCLSWLRASAIESSVPVSCNGLLGSWPASKLGCKNIRCVFCSRPLEETISNNSIQKANIPRRWNVCGQRRQTNLDLPKRKTKCWSAAVETWWYWHLMSPDTSWYGRFISWILWLTCAASKAVYKSVLTSPNEIICSREPLHIVCNCRSSLAITNHLSSASRFV